MTRKLKSEKGASILVALIIFLTAAMISMVILSAAVTGVKTVHNDAVRQKESLSISSAAKLLSKCIAESSVTITTVTTEVEGEEPETTITYQTTGSLGESLRQILDDLPLRTTHEFVVALDAENVCKFAFEVNPAGSYEDPTDPYKIKGIVQQEGGEQNVYLTAWIPSTPTPVISTQQIEEEHKTITTSVTVYKWNKVELSTTGGRP